MSELDRVIHEPARLQIVALLSAVKEADFLFLLRETGFTKGNLSSHLAKLEEVGYVEIEKTFRGKIPLTVIRLTTEGTAAVGIYRKTMKSLLEGKPAATRITGKYGIQTP
jgi:DNA-binding transcriptional ArsR family regulator